MKATHRKLKLLKDHPIKKYKEFLWEATFVDGEVLNFVNRGQCVPDVQGHHKRFIYKYVKKDYIGKRVLDAGCGCGCGSNLISGQANHVVGVEVEQDIASYGQKRYGNDKCLIIQGDVQSLEYENEFDTAVCIDVIEHMHDSKKALQNLYRVVKHSGIIVITTPDRGTLVKSGNPYHIFEWNLQEFRENISWMGKSELSKPWKKSSEMFARIEVVKN